MNDLERQLRRLKRVLAEIQDEVGSVPEELTKRIQELEAALAESRVPEDTTG